MEKYCSWCHQSNRLLSQPSVQNTPKSPICPLCHRTVTLITIRRACDLVSKSKKTIYTWIDKGLVTVVRSASGGPLICLSSLFIPTSEEGDDRIREPKPTD